MLSVFRIVKKYVLWDREFRRTYPPGRVFAGAIRKNVSRDFFFCTVADRNVGIAADAVAVILPILPLWRSPTLPDAVAGFIELRGRFLPVLATAVVLGLENRILVAHGFSHIICPTGVSASRPCLLVDRVDERRSVDGAAIGVVDAANSLNGLVTGEIATDDGVAHVIELDRLLDRFERERLGQITEMAQHRAARWAERAPA